MLKEIQANLKEKKIGNNKEDKFIHNIEENINISISNNSKKCKKIIYFWELKFFYWKYNI